jgi:DNA-binding transcriptional MerR regulator
MKSIATLAENLGVTPAIIRSWQINLNLEHPRYSPEEPVYDDSWQNFFEEVARLRKQGHSFSKIRAVLSASMPSEASLPAPGAAPKNGNGNGNGNGKKAPEVPEPPAETSQQNLSFSFNSREPRSYAPEESSQSLVAVNPQSNLPSMQNLQRNMHEALLHQDLTKMAQTYVQLMENYQTLASRYSESTYVLGQMEEKNRSMETLLHEKETHFHEKEQAQMQRIQELESHLANLRQSLNRREADLSHSQEQLVTKDEISQVEKQLKLLAVTVFQQQEELAKSQNAGFWSKLKQRLFK